MAFQRQMKTVMAGIQIQKAVATSKVFKSLTDAQVKELSEGKFTTSSQFQAFMQNPNTEVLYGV